MKSFLAVAVLLCAAVGAAADDSPDELFSWWDGLDPPVATELRKAGDLLARARRALDEPLAERFETDESSSWRRLKLVALARECARRGETDLATKLLDRCGRERKAEDAGPLKTRLSFDVAPVLFDAATRAFGDPAVSRSELLARCRAIVAKLPETLEGRVFAKDRAAELERQIAEDAAHVVPPGWPNVAPDVAAREWVFRLRDEVGGTWKWPGGSTYALTWPKDESSATYQLFRLGPDAVPALLDALGDDGPTRVFIPGRSGETYVESVDAVARHLLGAMTGRWLQGDAAAVRAEVGAWTAKVRELGEERALVEAVSRGDREGALQAALLFERHPAAALRAFVAGARTGGAQGVERDTFVRLAALFPGDESMTFLLEELSADVNIATRVAAAKALHSRGRTDAAVDAMIRSWRKDEPEYGFTDVIEFLAECGEPRAIDALREGVDRRHAGLRINVVTDVGTAAKPRKDRRAPSAEWRAAAERLLVERLTDRERQMGLWIGDWSNPRVCDMAASELTRLGTDAPAKPPTNSTSARDRECVALANSWRAAHDLPPLPVPETPTIPPTDADALAGLLAEARAAREDARLQETFDRIVALGLGALPAVEKAAEMDADAPGRAAFERLARDVASIVRTAEIAPGVTPPEEAARSIAGLRGRPLRTTDVLDVLRTLGRTLPDEADGFEVVLTRPEDGSGVALRVGYRRREDVGPPKPIGGYQTVVFRSGVQLEASTSSCIPECVTGPDEWKDLGKALDRALAAGPHEPYEATVEVHRDH